MEEIQNNIRNNSCTLIDVREPFELEIDGNVPTAVNIPMAQIPNQMETIQEMVKPVYIFCRSGGRAENVKQYLAQQNIEVENIGGFEAVLAIQNS